MLDTGAQPTHDQAMGSPSLVETMARLPGTLLRLPGTSLRALDALITLADRIDRLLTLLEQMDNGLARAGSGVDLAASGITQAVSGLERAVGLLDVSLPNLSDTATTLRTLTERLSGVAIELATELPKTTASLQGISPELSRVAGTLNERFGHLDSVVTDLAKLVEAVVGTIPGMRRVLRTHGV
jgi:ABC-type transporter Mla subunit MlaD